MSCLVQPGPDLRFDHLHSLVAVEPPQLLKGAGVPKWGGVVFVPRVPERFKFGCLGARNQMVYQLSVVLPGNSDSLPYFNSKVLTGLKWGALYSFC